MFFYQTILTQPTKNKNNQTKMNTINEFTCLIKSIAETMVGYLNEQEEIGGVNAKVEIDIESIGGELLKRMGYDTFLEKLFKGVSLFVLDSKNLSQTKKDQICAGFDLAVAFPNRDKKNKDGKTEIILEYTPKTEVKGLKKLCKKMGGSFKQTCSHCHALKAVLLKCSACKNERYCDVECQKKAWKAGHKHECAGRNAKA